MKVKEFLAQEITACSEDDNLHKAALLMEQSDFDALPVAHKSGLIKIITKDDVCSAVANFDRKTSTIKIGELTLEDAVTCEYDEKIEKALKILSKKRVKHLVITGKNNQPIGIISLPKFLAQLDKEKKLRKKAFSVLEDIYKPSPLVLHEIDINLAAK